MPALELGRLGLACLMAVSVVACGDDAAPAKNKANGQKGLNVLTKGTANAEEPAKPAAPAAPATPAAEGEAGEEDVTEIAYAYSPIGKRDPFRSLFDQLQSEEISGATTELQKFELDQLRLVAIISRIATPYAMVEDPESKGHTLTRGTLIGKNWGRVAEINQDCVVIKEEYRDYTGRKVTNKTPMCLPKPQELKLD